MNDTDKILLMNILQQSLTEGSDDDDGTLMLEEDDSRT